MVLYSLCYPELKENDDEFITSFRQEHDIPYRDVVSHHFTMVFGIKDIDKKSYVDHIRQIANIQNSISFVCRYAMLGDDVVDDVYYVFLVPDEGYSQISKLHDKLYTGPLKPFLSVEIPYIPHMGIATIPNAEKVKSLCDDLNSKGLNISGRLSHITVCEYINNRIFDLERIEFMP